ncbi:hypothetical protein GDO78_009542 [Eleutherodactylus coqui]|uniref:Uncharacterized protein n=1 Tax=Eleutherodactylus coqui TaxID=57060 RepID=A0A8J6FA49_ELECQ|nr:hypothetical protein GDO78_009542 [Eleutherodactylus coqui]
MSEHQNARVLVTRVELSVMLESSFRVTNPIEVSGSQIGPCAEPMRGSSHSPIHEFMNGCEIPHDKLGRVLLNTLERCREPQHGKEHIFDVLDTLYHELSVCELLHHQHNEEDSGQSRTSSLVISC